MMHTHKTPRNSQPFKGNTQPLILLVIIFLVFTIMVASYVAYESSMNYLHTTFANFNPIPNGDGQRQFDLTSFFISINKHNSDGNHISESNMKTLTKQYVAEAVKVAEWQWKYQKWELDQNMYEKYNDNLKRYNPNYPCFLGEQVAGHVDITDGNKWVCGLSHIGHGFENIDNPDRKNHSCIIYSIGSRNNFQFEESILQNAPKHCQVHTFDPYSIYDHAPYHTRFHFHQIGVDYRDYVTTDNRHFQTIPDIMKSLNHQHIDILKIDVEGAEWPVFTKLNFSSNTWPIGQIQIESMYCTCTSEKK